MQISYVNWLNFVFCLKLMPSLWPNYNAMFYETFICFYVSEAKCLCFSLCLMMLNDVEHTTFKMFVTLMSNYIFVISFQLMFYKTLRYCLATAQASI